MLRPDVPTLVCLSIHDLHVHMRWQQPFSVSPRTVREISKSDPFPTVCGQTVFPATIRLVFVVNVSCCSAFLLKSHSMQYSDISHEFNIHEYWNS